MILLARHGHHDEIGRVLSGRSDIALSDRGRAEAARLAAHLATVELTGVHSSPRRRALETAQPVAAAHGLEIVVTDDLDEIDFGDWQGRSFADLEDRPDWRRWNAARGQAATPAGDTMRAVTARALRHVEAQPEAAHVLCVSHCDVIRGLVAHCRGLDPDRLLSFDIEVGSLTTIDMAGGTPRVVAVNQRAA